MSYLTTRATRAATQLDRPERRNSPSRSRPPERTCTPRFRERRTMSFDRDGHSAFHDFDLHQWFREGELERCPECGEVSGVRLPNGSFLCLGCGHLTTGNAQPAASLEGETDKTKSRCRARARGSDEQAAGRAESPVGVDAELSSGVSKAAVRPDRLSQGRSGGAVRIERGRRPAPARLLRVSAAESRGRGRASPPVLRVG
jgi:hypothetical protein